MRILMTLSFIFCLLSTALGDIQFEEVSHQAGITRIGESWGNAWGDFDGDGYLDLWATNHKHKPSLYRNNRDGTFTDIIDEVWDANPHADTHGVAWADFDNDGDQDLIVLCGSGGGTNPTNPKHDNHFYINENGMLIERASEFGIDFPKLRGRAPLWLDWNRDGHLDLLLTGRTRPDRDGGLVKSSLFEQTQNSFINMNHESGCQIDKDSSLAQLTDLTNDGVMEVVVDGSPYPQEVYDISLSYFRTLTDTINFPKIYNVQDVAFADFNGDLLPDLFVARGIYRSFIDTDTPKQIKIQMQTNRGEKGVSFKTEGDVRFEIHSVWTTRVHQLFIGNEGHTLKEFGGEHIPTDPIRNVASFIFVLSPDDPRIVGLKPRPEVENYGIYVGYNPEQKIWTLLYHTNPTINTNWTGLEARIKSEHLFSEVEHINFTRFDLSANPQSRLLINKTNRFVNTVNFSEGRSVAVGDFDNDMDIDLYLVRSSSAGNRPNHLYENLGDGTFIQHPNAGGAEASLQGKGQSVTMADYDQDGYLDLFVTNGRGGYPFNNGPDQLFRNFGSGNNWLQIDLEGNVSNRDGIGAKFYATTPDGKTQLRENGGGIHWSQQDQKRIHFGLAQNEKVSELVIHWPSGILQKLTDIEANQVLHVVEDGIQTQLPGDVNRDGQVDILDLLVVVSHFGEDPPSNARSDTNKDGQVNLEDVVWIIKIIEENQNSAAPLQRHSTQPIPNTMSNGIASLSDTDIALLYSFYQKIEEMPENSTQIQLVKRFLRHLLIPENSPLETKLYANYPNPFNPETWIPYQLAEDTEISIRIYNTEGKIVKTLFSGHQKSGYYITRSKAAYWDGRNEFGEAVASGVYIYELVTPKTKHTKRLVVIK
jgi:hypothetical protein